MAEAAVDHNQSRFFCHLCKVEISPNIPEYTCPRCDNGFIEHIEEDAEESNPDSGTEFTDPDPAAQFAEFMRRTFLESLQRHTEGGDLHLGSDDETPTTNPTDGGAPEPAEPRRNLFPPHTRISVRRVGGPHQQAPPLNALIQQLIGFAGGGLLGGQQPGSMPMIFNLHGNPGDYAWGPGGLDTIITQLMNQLDGNGPPPASKEDIDSLPSVIITNKQVDESMQCSVCMEEFALEEKVRKLPCNHHYHTDCIVPWLEMHGTCPVCRKTLLGEDTSMNQEPQIDPSQPNSDANNTETNNTRSSSNDSNQDTPASQYFHMDGDFD